MSESDFNKKFRQAMTVRGLRMHRIESHGTAPGIPDNFFISIGTGTCGWIEVKQAREGESPKKIDYRPGQVPWLIQYTKDGGRCGTVLHIPAGNIVILIKGQDSAKAEQSLWGTPHQGFT